MRNMFLPLVQVIQQYWSASGFIESISNPFFVRSAVVQYCMQFLKKLCCTESSDQDSFIRYQTLPMHLNECG